MSHTDYEQLAKALEDFVQLDWNSVPARLDIILGDEISKITLSIKPGKPYTCHVNLQTSNIDIQARWKGLLLGSRLRRA